MKGSKEWWCHWESNLKLIVSLIRHDHCQSSDHKGVLSFGLLPAVICSKITNINCHTQQSNCMHSSTQSLSASHKDEKEGWLSVGVVARWQSAGKLIQSSGFDSQQHHLSLEPFAVSKGSTVTAQIVSLIRHDHYRSADHRGVLSIGFRRAVICSKITHIKVDSTTCG